MSGQNASPLSASPNPRPTIFEGAHDWSDDQLQYLVREYNAMVRELDVLAGHIVHLGGDPKQVLAQAEVSKD